MASRPMPTASLRRAQWSPAPRAPSTPCCTGAASADSDNAPPIPEMSGTFRIVTDGQILANNTDEGPQATPEGQVLEWRVNRRTGYSGVHIGTVGLRCRVEDLAEAVLRHRNGVAPGGPPG